ncbi:MAG: hypothetical protein K0Q87_3494 [Neobacillus sp.]|jgi:hypothetical protein|nr:hypothetical protein [Neobacillus sp.]
MMQHFVKGMMETLTLKMQGLLNIAMVLLSWLTLPLMGSRNIKRFLPATVLILFIEILHAGYGKKQKWWVFYNKPNTRLFGEFPINIGPFMVISLWFLKWTYGNFNRFILLNGMTSAIFAYPITFFARKFRYFTLVRFNNFQFFWFFFFKAFLLYGFQYLFEMIREFNSKS